MEATPRSARALRSATASPTKLLRTPTTPLAPSPMTSRPASNEASARRDAKKRVMERRDSRLLKHGTGARRILEPLDAVAADRGAYGPNGGP